MTENLQILEDNVLFLLRDKLENELAEVNREIRIRSNTSLINSALEKEGE
jgi:hypothetical protein